MRAYISRFTPELAPKSGFRRVIFSILGVSLGLSLCLSMSAHADDQARSLPVFTSIKSKGACTVLVEVGKAQSIVVTGDEKFIANVVTEVVGDDLVISFRENKSFTLSDAAQVMISLPVLNKVSMEGVGNTTINNVSGARLDLAYKGTGVLRANGKVKFLSLRAEGVGLVDTKNLLAEQVDVSLQGVGAVKVFASERLTASVQGIGSLRYYGAPHSISKSVEGIGRVSAGDW